MTEQTKNEMISRIIELELQNIKLIFDGHKPTEDDFFEPSRKEMAILRCIVFGYDSKFCKIKKGSHGNLFL
jgi:hypothetical protein